jgi:hypothetical protein
MDRRQTGHYTRFGVTSGWGVIRPGCSRRAQLAGGQPRLSCDFVVIVPLCCQIENSGLLASDRLFPFIEDELVSSGRPIKPMLKAQLRSCPLKSETTLASVSFG